MFKETNIKAFEKKLWLASPTMYPDSLKYVHEAYETGWMSTVGANINEIEKQVAQYVGMHHAAALSSGTASLHLAIRLAGIEAYGMPSPGHGAVEGRLVFCSDMTFDATANSIVYEGGIPVFIDIERESLNTDPVALEKAFQIYPEVRIVMLAHLYGTPAKMDEIMRIVRKHNAILIEDAAESLGAVYKGQQTGSFGKYNAISFNGNKIITGSSGGCFLTDDPDAADKVLKWSTQSREKAPWYQHKELGYNYRMSNVIAGIIRGQFPYLEKHIEEKKAIYDRYKHAFKDLPISMNPIPENCRPNHWLSCILIDENAMCRQVRGEHEATYLPEKGKNCPHEILDALEGINTEGRPMWKPMHMQPFYRNNPFVTRDGNGRAGTDAYTEDSITDAGMDIFHRGLCLPSDIKMTEDQQEKIIEIVHCCFL